MSSLEKRIIKFVFDMGTSGGVFADGTTNKPIQGYRASVEISRAGGQSMSECHAKIFGLSQDDMNQLTKLGGTLVNPNPKFVSISAGTTPPLAQIFEGPIQQGWVDLQGGPEAPFTILAYAGIHDALTPAPPTSVEGGANVVTVMQQLADAMNYKFEPNDVKATVDNLYLAGTKRDQAYLLAQQANINILIDNGILAIWPKTGPRSGGPYDISPRTGMVGYPTFTDKGIMVRTIFRPDIAFGTQINIQSSLTPAAGAWNIFDLSYQLDCEMPGGKWFTTIEASKQGTGVVPEGDS